MTNIDSPKYPIASAARTLRLIKELKRRPQLSVSQAKELLGVGASTAHRLIQMLAYEGFAVRDPKTRTYMAGPELVGFDPIRGSYTDLIAKGKRVIKAVVSHCNETSQLAVLNGTHIRYITGIEGSAILRVSTRIGDIMPAYATSSGKAMLASYSDEVVEAMFKNVRFEKITRHTVTSLDELLGKLQKIRANGYATNHEEAEDGVSSTSIGVPIPGPSSMVSISIATPSSRQTDHKILEHASILRSASRRLATDLRASY